MLTNPNERSLFELLDDLWSYLSPRELSILEELLLLKAKFATASSGKILFGLQSRTPISKTLIQQELFYNRYRELLQQELDYAGEGGHSFKPETLDTVFHRRYTEIWPLLELFSQKEIENHAEEADTDLL